MNPCKWSENDFKNIKSRLNIIFRKPPTKLKPPKQNNCEKCKVRNLAKLKWKAEWIILKIYQNT